MDKYNHNHKNNSYMHSQQESASVKSAQNQNATICKYPPPHTISPVFKEIDQKCIEQEDGDPSMDC